jgi:hypothetical protein
VQQEHRRRPAVARHPIEHLHISHLLEPVVDLAARRKRFARQRRRSRAGRSLQFIRSHREISM